MVDVEPGAKRHYSFQLFNVENLMSTARR